MKGETGEPTAVDASTPVTAKKSKKEKKSRKPKATSNHPKVADMVNEAIDLQAEKGGSSLQSIKRYISSTYKVDMNRQAIFVRRYLKKAVDEGSVVRTKGQGALGSFRRAPSAASTKTARQQVLASKPQKPAIKTSPKKAKKSKALAKSPVVKKLKAKTSVKKIKAETSVKKIKAKSAKSKKAESASKKK